MNPLKICFPAGLWLLVNVLGVLPLAARPSFQDWYGLLTGSWSNPSFPVEISTTFSYANRGCSQIDVTLDGEELPRSSAGSDNERIWSGRYPLIKQTWLSDKHVRVTVWLESSVDAIDSVMAFARNDEIRLYYVGRVNKWEGPAGRLACIWTHRLTYDIQNIHRRRYEIKIEKWDWSGFYIKLLGGLALVALASFGGYLLYRWNRRRRILPSTPTT